MTKAHAPINSIPDLNNHPSDWYGLTKREYFAAMAMQGLLSDADNCGNLSDIVFDAVKMADMLIEQLNK